MNNIFCNDKQTKNIIDNYNSIQQWLLREQLIQYVSWPTYSAISRSALHDDKMAEVAKRPNLFARNEK